MSGIEFICPGALLLWGAAVVVLGIKKLGDRKKTERARQIEALESLRIDSSDLFAGCEGWDEVAVRAAAIVNQRIGGRWLNGEKYVIEVKKGADFEVDNNINFIERYGKNHGVELIYTDHPDVNGKIKVEKWRL